MKLVRLFLLNLEQNTMRRRILIVGINLSSTVALFWHSLTTKISASNVWTQVMRMHTSSYESWYAKKDRVQLSTSTIWHDCTLSQLTTILTTIAIFWSIFTGTKTLLYDYQLGGKGLDGALSLFRFQHPQFWKASTTHCKVHPLFCKIQRDQGQTYWNHPKTSLPLLYSWHSIYSKDTSIILLLQAKQRIQHIINASTGTPTQARLEHRTLRIKPHRLEIQQPKFQHQTERLPALGTWTTMWTNSLLLTLVVLESIYTLNSAALSSNSHRKHSFHIFRGAIG